MGGKCEVRGEERESRSERRIESDEGRRVGCVEGQRLAVTARQEYQHRSTLPLVI